MLFSMPWLFRFKGKSKVWWVGYRLHGQQFLRSTGQRDKEKAQVELNRVNALVAAQKANALTHDVFLHLTGKAVPSVTLKSALADWINEAKGATSPRTSETYLRVESDLLDFFKANDRGPMMADITRADLQRYLSERRGAVSASTSNMSRKLIGIFFKRSKACGYLRENPVDGIPFFKLGREEQRIRRPFTHKEIATLYQTAPDDFWRYMVLGGFTTGLRLGDLVTMPVGAVDWKKKAVRIVTRKTGRQMFIPLAPPFFKLLQDRQKEIPSATGTEPIWPEHAARYNERGSGWFGQRFYDLLLIPAGLAKSRPHRKSAAKKTRRTVNEVSFHCLRHSFVTTMASSGQNQQVVKELAGHSGDDVNDLYTHVPPAVLTAAIKQLPDVTR